MYLVRCNVILCWISVSGLVCRVLVLIVFCCFGRNWLSRVCGGMCVVRLVISVFSVVWIVGFF